MYVRELQIGAYFISARCTASNVACLFHVSSSFIHRKMQTVHVIKLSNRGHCFTSKTFFKTKVHTLFRWMFFSCKFLQGYDTRAINYLKANAYTHIRVYAERGRKKETNISMWSLWKTWSLNDNVIVYAQRTLCNFFYSVSRSLR